MNKGEGFSWEPHVVESMARNASWLMEATKTLPMPWMSLSIRQLVRVFPSRTLPLLNSLHFECKGLNTLEKLVLVLWRDTTVVYQDSTHLRSRVR